MALNKKKDLDKAAWVNQVILFLQSFCFSIELLAFQSNNIKLCRARRYCSCLTHFGSIFPFMPPENIKYLWFSDVSKGSKKLILTSTDLVLVVYIETTTFYNPSALKTIDWENKLIYLRFCILNSVFSTLNWYSAFFHSTI